LPFAATLASSLITYPETTTHQRLKPEQHAALGISPGLLRMSVALADVEDLIEDLAQALDKPPRRRIEAERVDALSLAGKSYFSKSASVGMRPFGVRLLMT
jgi:Cys/Met metabolism PLP-dependent enzyme